MYINPFAKALWPFDPSDREGAWRICIEGLAAGANAERIKDLAAKWGCDDADARIYADRIGLVCGVEGDMLMVHRLDFVDLQASEAGFGTTYLEAMSDLAHKLGYVPNKMWGNTFKDLVSK